MTEVNKLGKKTYKLEYWNLSLHNWYKEKNLWKVKKKETIKKNEKLYKFKLCNVKKGIVLGIIKLKIQ
jgi:hypothetical protein